jgi:uncharacterized repeat protein (TIGR02543 family)
MKHYEKTKRCNMGESGTYMKKVCKRILALILVYAFLFGTGAVGPVKASAAADNIANQVMIGQVYMFRNRQSGQYMTALHDDTVEQRAFSGQSNQQWKIFNKRGQVSYNYTYFGGTQPTNQTAKTGLKNIQMTAAGLTLYAIYEDKIPVSYNFSYNGGTSVTTAPYGFYKGESVDLTPKATKTGWDFQGWNTDPDATVPLASLTMSDVAMPGASFTLYAIYRLTTSVKFVDYNNFGVVNRIVSVITHNLDVPTPQHPYPDRPRAKQPYRFDASWLDTPSGRRGHPDALGCGGHCAVPNDLLWPVFES